MSNRTLRVRGQCSMHASGVHRFAIFRTRRVALRAPHLATLRARLRRAQCTLSQNGNIAR